MKKIHELLLVLLMPLFLFTQNVEAENITATYSDFTPVSSSTFATVKSLADELGYPYVIIYEINGTYPYQVIVHTANDISVFNVSRNSTTLRLTIPASYRKYYYDAAVSSLFASGSGGSPYNISLNNNWASTNFQFLYSSLSVYNSGTYSIDITDTSTLITCSRSSFCNDLPMNTFYNSYVNSEPPTPPDNTPLLTSFVTITIDRLNYICNFITSSYIYLSIFVVFILMFVILLIRRLR